MKKFNIIVICLIIISLGVSCKLNRDKPEISSNINTSSITSYKSEVINESDISNSENSYIQKSNSLSSSLAISSSMSSKTISSLTSKPFLSKSASSTISAIISKPVIPTATPTPVITPFTNFITRITDKLMDGDQEFKYVGNNLQSFDPSWMRGFPNWENSNTDPTNYEIEDMVKTASQIGSRVIRVYALSVGNFNSNYEAHVTGIGQFSETAFKRLDKLFEMCNKYKIRAILGLVDYWDTIGGISTYTNWRNKEKAEFFTDPQIIADFKLTIDYVTNRYRNEKALLCWSTGNEMPINSNVDAWARDITAYIKSKDPNHLVKDSRLSMTANISFDSLNNPNVDIVSGHYYHWVRGTDYPKYCKDDKALSKDKKVFIVTEFGYAGYNISMYRDLLNEVISNGTSGISIWAMAHRNENGGFYWHDGYHTSIGHYSTYHWPGFQTGSEYNEIETLALMREYAYLIRGMSIPPLPIPDAPFLFPITKISAINWRGSTGASSYNVERAESINGPWQIVGEDIIDARDRYTSLFDDFFAQSGVNYYYRIIAKNSSGTSRPSNVVGPIKGV